MDRAGVSDRKRFYQRPIEPPVNPNRLPREVDGVQRCDHCERKYMRTYRSLSGKQDPAHLCTEHYKPIQRNDYKHQKEGKP